MIIYSFNEKARDIEKFKQRMKEIAFFLPVYFNECKGKTDYPDFLKKHWKEDMIINIEHDIYATKVRITELMLCKEQNCTIPYILDHRSPHLSIFNIQHLGTSMQTTSSFIHIPDNTYPEYCDASGIGFVKIGLKTQHMFDFSYFEDDPVKDWSHIDSWLGFKFKQFNLRWHVHYPMVAHHHF